MAFLKSCKKYFKKDNLYEILGITAKATETELKRSYRRMALLTHPDRVTESEKEEATEKFKILGRIYNVLSDSDTRAVYDQTGEVDDECAPDAPNPSEACWSKFFRKITKQDIVKFENEYKGSQSELDDIKAAYLESKGDMQGIINGVYFATIDDEPRLRSSILKMIEADEVPAFKLFTSEPEKRAKARKRKAQKEAAEAEELAKELGFNNDNSLEKMILARNQDRKESMDKFLDSLATKYSKPSNSGRKKSQPKKKTKSASK